MAPTLQKCLCRERQRKAEAGYRRGETLDHAMQDPESDPEPRGKNGYKVCRWDDQTFLNIDQTLDNITRINVTLSNSDKYTLVFKMHLLLRTLH